MGGVSSVNDMLWSLGSVPILVGVVNGGVAVDGAGAVPCRVV